MAPLTESLAVDSALALERRAALLERKRRALDLLAPDLERSEAGGWTVRAFYRPTLAAAALVDDARATVEILQYGAAVDSLDVPAAAAFDVWAHAAVYSETYAAALTAPREGSDND